MGDTVEEGRRRYDAFLSYSQAEDRKLAAELRRDLQLIGTPFWRRRAHRVFLDQTSISANPSAWNALAQAIDQSEFLVLMASPAAAASPWVAREIEHFVRRPDADERILLCLTAGELDWDEDAQTFTDASTACPDALRNACTHEPLFVDLRDAKDMPSGNERQRVLRDHGATLAAAVRGVEKDEIVGADLQAHRRNLSVAGSALVVLAILAVLSSVFWRQAVANARHAQAQTVSSLAQADVGNRIDRALLLATSSIELADSSATRRGLFEALTGSYGLQAVVHDHNDAVRSVAKSPDETIVVTGGVDGTVVVRDGELRPIHDQIPTAGAAIREIVIHPSNDWALIASDDGSVSKIDLNGGRVVATVAVVPNGEPVRTISLSPDGETAFAGGDYTAAIVVRTSPLEVDGVLGPEFRQIKAVDVSDDGRYLAMAGRRNDDYDEPPLVVLDLDNDGAIVAEGSDPTELPRSGCGSPCFASISSVAMLPGSGELLMGSLSGAVLRWRFDETQSPYIVAWHSDQVARVRVNRSGTHAVSTGFDHEVHHWSLKSEEERPSTRRHHGGQVWDAAVSDTHFITVSEDGSVMKQEHTRSVPAIGQTFHEPSGEDRIFDLEVISWRGAEAIAIASGRTVTILDSAGAELANLQPSLPKVDGSESPEVWSLGYDRRTQRLVGGFGNGLVAMWDAATGSELATTTTAIKVHAVAIHPMSGVVAVGGPSISPEDFAGNHGRIEFLGTEPAAEVPQVMFVDDGNTIRGMTFAADGSLFLAGGDPVARSILSWPTLAPVVRSGEAGPVATNSAIGPAGRVALGTIRQTVELLQSDGAPIETFEGHRDVVFAVSFSPDGQLLASGGGDDEVRLWDVGDRLAEFGPPLVGHTEWVNSAEFSSDGLKLYSASRNEVIAWELDPDRWVELACNLAARQLTSDEWDALVGVGSVPTDACSRKNGS